MKNTAAKIARRTHQFVADHKVGLAVTATAATCITVHVKVIKNVNERLKELGVYDEFYSTVEDNI